VRVRLPIVSVLAGLLLAATPAAAAATRQVIGHSVAGRPIVSWRQGDPDPDFRLLVVGSIHGDERQGMRVVSRLRQILAGASGPRGIGVWTVKTSNPDGTAAGTRRNSRRVDLNRNFPYRWDGRLDGGYNSGPRPASEPETGTMMRFSRRVEFDLAIWFHQPWGRTLAPCDSQRRWAFLYARLSGLGTGGRCDHGRYPGSAVSWQHHALGTTAFVVEFGSGIQSRTVIARHARAVIRLAKRMR
jgi:predicted deacylase